MKVAKKRRAWWMPAECGFVIQVAPDATELEIYEAVEVAVANVFAQRRARLPRVKRRKS